MKNYFICFFIIITICFNIVAVDDNYNKTDSTLVIIGRPNSYGYDLKEEYSWMSAIINLYLHHSLNYLDEYRFVSMNVMENGIDNIYDYSKRIPKSKYFNFAHKKNAKFLLYSEYEAYSNDSLSIHFSLIVPDTKYIVSNFTLEISINNFSNDMFDIIQTIINKLGHGKKDVFGDSKSEYFYISDISLMRQIGKMIVECYHTTPDKSTDFGTLFEKIATNNSKLFIVYSVATDCYLRGKEYSKALFVKTKQINQFKNISKKDYLNLGYITALNGDYLSAKEIIDKIIDTTKTINFDKRIVGGLIFEMEKKTQEAINLYEKLILSFPQAIEPYKRIASLLLQLGRIDDSQNYCEIVAQLSGAEISDVYREIADKYLTDGDTLNAISAYNKYLSYSVNDFSVREFLANIELNFGMDIERVKQYKLLYNRNPIKFDYCLDSVSYIYLRLNELKNARQMYKEAFSVQESPQVLVSWANFERQFGDCDTALSIINNLPSTWINNQIVVEIMGQCTRDTTTPHITLKGNDTIFVNGGDDFVEPGYSVVDAFDGDLSSRVKVINGIIADSLGDFKIEYSVSDTTGNRTICYRVVCIIDTTAPYIELKGDSIMWFVVGEQFNDPGITIRDAVTKTFDGLVIRNTDIDTSLAGYYMIDYEVSDNAGNRSYISRRVNLFEMHEDIDTISPQFVLFGSDKISIEIGGNYLLPKMTVLDDKEGDITGNMISSGEVNNLVSGVYHLFYKASDKAGNISTKTIAVTVTGLISNKDSMSVSVSTSSADISKPIVVPKKKKNISITFSRKPVLSVVTTTIGIGGVFFGFMMNQNLPDLQIEYDAAGRGDVSRVHEDMEKTILLRNVGYIIGGVCALGFTINIVIPNK